MIAGAWCRLSYFESLIVLSRLRVYTGLRCYSLARLLPASACSLEREGFSMNPEPTDTISLDYLVELRDDGNQQADQQKPEVIVIPPAPQGIDPTPAPVNPPDQSL
jgi:hypothetical protein